MNLTNLQNNQRAVIVNCQEKQLPLKLMEMGCIDGVQVQLLNRAPLGTPLYFLIGDTRIALGKEIADEIEVELIDHDSTKEKA
jgi:ferrous iron transport protein A